MYPIECLLFRAIDFALFARSEYTWQLWNSAGRLRDVAETDENTWESLDPRSCLVRSAFGSRTWADIFRMYPAISARYAREWDFCAPGARNLARTRYTRGDFTYTTRKTYLPRFDTWFKDQECAARPFICIRDSICDFLRFYLRYCALTRVNRRFPQARS